MKKNFRGWTRLAWLFLTLASLSCDKIQPTTPAPGGIKLLPMDLTSVPVTLLSPTDTPGFPVTVTPTDTPTMPVTALSPTATEPATFLSPTDTATFPTTLTLSQTPTKFVPPTRTPTFPVTFTGTPTSPVTITLTETPTLPATFLSPTDTSTEPVTFLTPTDTPSSPATGTSPTASQTAALFTPTATLTAGITLFSPTPSPTSTMGIPFPPAFTVTPTRTPYIPIRIATPPPLATQVIHPTWKTAIQVNPGFPDRLAIFLPGTGAFSPNQGLFVMTTGQFDPAELPVGELRARFELLSPVYVLDTQGVEPVPGAKITYLFHFDPGKAGAGTASGLKVAYRNGNKWVIMPARIDPRDHTAEVVVDHFSLWALVKKKHPFLRRDPDDGQKRK